MSPSSSKMNVSLSVPGRFHIFNLAHELERRGRLLQLITSYPKFEAARYGIPRKRIDTVLRKEIVQRMWEKAPAFLRRRVNVQYAALELFDRSAEKLLKPANIFVGCSSASLRTLHAAKNKGMKTILERGSSHILHQTQILKEEYERFGVKARLTDPRIIEKELKEYQEADYISIPSLFVKKTFLDKGAPESKLIHVPYGVDLAEFRQAAHPDGVFRVVYAGGMTLQKGVHYLLQAFAEMKLRNAELLLLGEKSDEIEPFFKKYAGSFRWVGRVPQRELASHYNRSSVFVLNSIQDGFGMVMLQAMACGLPVVASENTGGPDVIQEGIEGFIIPIRNAEKLKEKLAYLYENPEIRERMGLAARARAAQGFSWSDYGNKMVAEYERISALKVSK